MGQSQNAVRLRVLASTFGVSVSTVAKTLNVSRSKISRLISPNDAFDVKSSAFWWKVEEMLPELLKHRTRRLFDVECVPADELEACLKK